MQYRILIRAANWVGDAIMTTPVIRAIRKSYPDAWITLLAKPWVTPVFKMNPYIDEIMIYDNEGRHTRGFGTLRLSKDLRQKKFDLAILMQNAFEAALITFLGGVQKRIGYDTDGRGALLNQSVRMNPWLKEGHLIDYYRGILKGAGIADDGRDLDIFLSHSEREVAGNLIRKSGCSPVIGINPGAAGGTAKRWFPERYAELAGKLSARFGTKILIFGSSQDRELGNEINEASGRVCINLSGSTSLREAFALIERCDLFITNDSGLMHAAAALKTRQIAIIGSTDHRATSPSGFKSRIIRFPVPCSPCLKPHCPLGHHICMDKIDVATVMDECESILGKGK